MVTPSLWTTLGTRECLPRDMCIHMFNNDVYRPEHVLNYELPWLSPVLSPQPLAL